MTAILGRTRWGATRTSDASRTDSLRHDAAGNPEATLQPGSDIRYETAMRSRARTSLRWSYPLSSASASASASAQDGAYSGVQGQPVACRREPASRPHRPRTANATRGGQDDDQTLTCRTDFGQLLRRIGSRLSPSSLTARTSNICPDESPESLLRGRRKRPTRPPLAWAAITSRCGATPGSRTRPTSPHASRLERPRWSCTARLGRGSYEGPPSRAPHDRPPTAPRLNDHVLLCESDKHALLPPVARAQLPIWVGGVKQGV